MSDPDECVCFKRDEHELRDPTTAVRAALEEWEAASVARTMAFSAARLAALDADATAADLLRSTTCSLLAGRRLRYAEEALDREWLFWAERLVGDRP